MDEVTVQEKWKMAEVRIEWHSYQSYLLASLTGERACEWEKPKPEKRNSWQKKEMPVKKKEKSEKSTLGWGSDRAGEPYREAESRKWDQVRGDFWSSISTIESFCRFWTWMCRSAAAAAPEAFSRACGVCFTEAPRVRAMLTTCGHLLCAWCAETLADGKGGRLVCPYCRENTGFIVLVEEEEEEVWELLAGSRGAC